MTSYLSPGIYIEEVPTAAQVVPGVTTSNMGIVGYAPRGPANEAVLVQSYEQYSRVFGGLIEESYMPLSMAAFFANGGRRAYVVRVPPADAVAADAKIQSSHYNSDQGTGDGALTAFSGTIETDNQVAPLVPGSVELRWRAAGTPVVASNTKNRADDADLELVDAQAGYDGLLAGMPDYDAGLDSVVRGTVTIKFSTAVSGAVAIAIPAGSSSVVNASVGTSGDGAFVIFDHKSGRFSLKMFGNHIPAAADVGNKITADFTPTTDNKSAQDCLGFIEAVTGATLADGQKIELFLNNATAATYTLEFDNNGTVSAGSVAVPFTGVDSVAEVAASIAASINGIADKLVKASVVAAGGTSYVRLLPASSTEVADMYLVKTGFSGEVQPALANKDKGSLIGDLNAALVQTIDYATGDWSLTADAAVASKVDILANYKRNAWDLNPISVGAWGNDIQVQVSGSLNYYDAASGQYSRFDVAVLSRENEESPFAFVEQFEELVFDDPNSAVYFADVINELSDLITVSEPAGDEGPGQLSAVASSRVLAGGDGLAAGQAVNTSLEIAVQPRSLRIVYTSGGKEKVIADDGFGNLTGDVAAGGTVNYTTGELVFSMSVIADAASLVTASFGVAVASNVVVETFGSVEKNYRRGTEGTFDANNWGRSQFTEVSALAADYEGMYAFNKIDEILQVVIPDFAGNQTVSQDQLDYANARAALPHGGDRFIILTTPNGLTPQRAVDWFRFSLARNSDYAALYWPWVRVTNPLANDRPMDFPPLAHIAGVYARTDNNRNVGKSPGGTVDGALTYLVGLERDPTLADRDIVYPNRINSLISGVNTGLAVWGVRTISNVPDWRYINARRLFMYLEKSVYNATWWIVFENNGPALWTRIKTQLDSFLSNLYSNGYFAGSSPSQAYFVICDSSNNTEATIDAGQVIIDIGVAPNKPAEFVRLRFQQKSLNS